MLQVLCGFTFTHETVREWEARFAPLLRVHTHTNETASLADQRRRFQEQWAEVCALLEAV